MTAARSLHGPREMASTTSRPVNPTANHSPSHRSGTIARIDVRSDQIFCVAIDNEYRPLAKAVHPRNYEQYRNITYDFPAVADLTPGQMSAVRMLRQLDEPFSTADVCVALDWSKARAERWLEVLKCKRVLDVSPNRRGHVWAEGWKR